MSARYSDDPRLAEVRAAQVRSYLLDRGWRQQRYPRPELWVFGGLDDDDGKPIVQVLPSSEALKDFRARLEELVQALSILEDRTRADVLTDILGYADPEPGRVNGAPAPARHPRRANTPRDS